MTTTIDVLIVIGLALFIVFMVEVIVTSFIAWRRREKMTAEFHKEAVEMAKRVGHEPIDIDELFDKPKHKHSAVN